ncbi:very-short-patch-repair endonuclease [Rhodoblastus acidophilus]|uniref:endonuclease domain-containing protein n=1 Tax=Rhodoblastus acidophilus TaxID=1074 RepID=UPI002224EF33|nr:endonuclease domain-containing protein [Rhodoblastus acidophilus]MCW2318425.1 very-short-patch-repair endonuclease [Rhodoblastus acidophilus]
MLFIELADAASAEALIERAISGLALTVAQLWPFLWDGEDFSDLRADALGRLSLPIRLRALKRRGIPLSPVWARAAISELIQDRSPRVRRASPDVEFTQLCNAISPHGLALATSLDAAASPEAFVRAVEWMATTAGAAVMVLSRDLPPATPPYERILFGARVFANPTDAARRDAGARPRIEAPRILAQPQVVGKPHPLSAIEQRIARRLQADEELRALFDHNQFVTDISGPRTQVDLLWSQGRVVVEFDGDEHWREKYRADRHRDYELLRAGYLVLRITNGEVLEDIGRALEKIRDIVRLRRRAAGGLP